MTCPLNQVLNHIILLAWNSKLQKQESLVTKHFYTSFHHPTLLLTSIHPTSFLHLISLTCFFFYFHCSKSHFFHYDFHPLIMQTPFQLLFHYQYHSDIHMPAALYLTAQRAWAQKSLFIPALSLIYPLCALNAFIISHCWSASMWSEYKNTSQGCT